MATREQTHEEAVAEFIEKCKASIGEERKEGVPPGPGTPYPWTTPFEAAIRYDSDVIRKYALTRGDDNPLFTDPEYGKRTRYGGQIAPSLALILARGPGGTGPSRPQGYPVGDFHAGHAWEFYDVVRVGDSRIKNTKKTTEFFEKPGAGQGRRLLILVEQLQFWDAHGDLRGRCSGTLILIPMPSMGSGRAMAVDRLGEDLLYTRKASAYSREDIERIAATLESERRQRRGAEPRYWEDVEVGDRIGTVTIPAFTLQDQIAGGSISAQTQGPWAYDEGEDVSWEGLHFEGAFHRNRLRRGGAGTHPITRWPWGPRDEHADALTAPYRGQPLPFDGGQHRSQLPHRLIANWMGDDGFIRRYQVALRRPVYYSDVCVYSGEVVKKWTEVQEGDNKPGGVPGKHTYHAVGIKVEGSNQVGQTMLQGSVTVYLPSRQHGPVQLPIPHPAEPAYVPYEKFYRDWYQ